MRSILYWERVSIANLNLPKQQDLECPLTLSRFEEDELDLDVCGDSDLGELDSTPVWKLPSDILLRDSVEELPYELSFLSHLARIPVCFHLW